MANQQVGEHLNQLSRVLFDRAAKEWYLSIGIEVAAVTAAAVLNLLALSKDIALIAALVTLLILGVAYALRLQFDADYDCAETMRRQSVFTEGLDWPVGPTQLADWSGRAGRRLRRKVAAQARDPNYYASQAPPGPLRLTEMTIESAFYIRQLYIRLRTRIWVLFGVFLVISVLVPGIVLAHALPDSIAKFIAAALYSLLPILLTANLLGWAFRLNRLIVAIKEVEDDLDRLHQAGAVTPDQVLRLASEYNCQHTNGFPIHPWLWRHWHGEIDELWRVRHGTTTTP